MKHATIFVILCALLIAGCTHQTPATNETATSPVNESLNGANEGDLITINYVLSLDNGTVVDTNDDALAKENNLKTYVKGPYQFILGQSSKVKGFDKAIVGIEVGQHKDVIIPPSEEEFIRIVNKTKLMSRFNTLDRHQAFPMESYLKYFKKKPIKGDVVYNPEHFVFKYQVLNWTNNTVITKMVLKEGEHYVLPSTQWNSSVVKLADNDSIFWAEPEENQTIISPVGNATVNLGSKSHMAITSHPIINTIFNESVTVSKGFSIPQQFIVTEVHESDFVIKRWGSLADKQLHLSVTLLNRTADVKEIKPPLKINQEM